MTDQEKIKVLAELDGWVPTLKTIPVWKITGYDGSGEYVNREVVVYENGTTTKTLENLPPYLTSYDAIIPLIQKQPRATLVQVVLSFKGQNDVSRMVDWLQYTPEQLADALIKVVGKWKD